MATSFSSKLVWTKYRIHQEELLNLAFQKRNAACYSCKNQIIDKRIDNFQFGININLQKDVVKIST